ncbi:MAG: RluA family pseudouridine synthase [Planctomycetaceae bacterium]|nr:RluA family pseudouridine synthase [Planctomycetaceae bacterium]
MVFEQVDGRRQTTDGRKRADNSAVCRLPSAVSPLYEDNHLLALSKPVGIATMGLPEGEETLLTLAKEYIKHKYDKPGNVYLGVVSRLDVPVSGVVLFARTSKAADRINEQFRNRTVQKTYLAIVEGTPPPQGRWTDRISDDKRHRHVCIDPSGKEASLSYKVLRRLGPNSLVEIQLETGRKHQIRLQFSSRGYPILGDRKYGSKTVIEKGITLHAQTLVVKHPTTGAEIVLTAPVPESWKRPQTADDRQQKDSR